jgi:DNA-binding NarL/FixJ family response regulator
MIRILLVDDHPAVRAGLLAVLRAEPGLVPLGAAGSVADLWPRLNATRPDVVVLDFHLPGVDGLDLCRQLKRTMPPPAVLLYSAFADASLGLAARLAGVDAVVHKGAPADELFDAIRRVARGETVLPPVPRELLEAAADRLDAEDLPVLDLAVDGTPPGEIAQILGLAPGELAARLDRMVARLKADGVRRPDRPAGAAQDAD